MTISTQALLKKMEEEILKAKQINDISKVREHIYSIKTLCDLLLDKDISTTIQQRPSEVHTVSNLTFEKSQPLKTDDGSNGDSIFDF